jgi:hypothetical protein
MQSTLRVTENRVLRRKFGPKRYEVMEGWRKLHNVELHSLYSTPNVIRMIKSRRMRWVLHTVCMGAMRNVYKILLEILKGRDHSEDLGIDGRIILNGS